MVAAAIPTGIERFQIARSIMGALMVRVAHSKEGVWNRLVTAVPVIFAIG
jgi:hypothetical protein